MANVSFKVTLGIFRFNSNNNNELMGEVALKCFCFKDLDFTLDIK